MKTTVLKLFILLGLLFFQQEIKAQIDSVHVHADIDLGYESEISLDSIYILKVNAYVDSIQLVSTITIYVNDNDGKVIGRSEYNIQNLISNNSLFGSEISVDFKDIDPLTTYFIYTTITDIKKARFPMIETVYNLTN